MKVYLLNPPFFPRFGRGCPFRCSFCSWPQSLMGRKYRVRSIGSVVEELEWVQQNLPQVKEVFFEDDTFTIDQGQVLAFAQEYLRRGLKIAWACNARVGMDYEAMKAMRQAHCRLLIVGYESGSPAILHNISEGITFGGGNLHTIAHKGIVVESHDYGQVEAVHLCLTHILSRRVREKIAGAP